MYSYQHRYHAGNFADIHKHVILIAVLEALRKKATPFCVLDAFAGEGVYNLTSKESQKNREYLAGFNQMQTLAGTTAPNFIQELLHTAKIYQDQQRDPQAIVYPGSPAIIYSKLRAQDRAIFIENHPAAYLELKNQFRGKTQAHIHKRDGMEATHALIPFKEKRGLIFIDPSYEVKEEYKTIGKLVYQAWSKFPQGIYLVWYPLLSESRHISLCQELQQKFQNIWQHEWLPNHNDTAGLRGSGVIMVNPPWNLDLELHDSLQFLTRFKN